MNYYLWVFTNISGKKLKINVKRICFRLQSMTASSKNFVVSKSRAVERLEPERVLIPPRARPCWPHHCCLIIAPNLTLTGNFPLKCSLTILFVSFQGCSAGLAKADWPTGQGDAYYLVGLKLHHPRVLPNLPKFCMKDPAGTQTLVIVTLSKLIYHHTNHINSMFCLLWMSRNFGFNSTNRIPKWWWVVGMLLQALIDIDVGRRIKKIRINKKS